MALVLKSRRLQQIVLERNMITYTEDWMDPGPAKRPLRGPEDFPEYSNGRSSRSSKEHSRVQRSDSSPATDRDWLAESPKHRYTQPARQPCLYKPEPPGARGDAAWESALEPSSSNFPFEKNTISVSFTDDGSATRKGHVDSSWTTSAAHEGNGGARHDRTDTCADDFQSFEAEVAHSEHSPRNEDCQLMSTEDTFAAFGHWAHFVEDCNMSKDVPVLQ